MRGTCDYADTHKNHGWHSYVSMTAAAYAKDLLRWTPLSRVQSEKKMVEMLAAIESGGSFALHLRSSVADKSQ